MNRNTNRSTNRNMNGNRRNANNHGNLLPFRVIEAAANGEVWAINKVLKRYEGYIIALSAKRMYDEDGNPHLVIDNEMRRTLETNLIVKVMQFDVNRIA